MRNEITTKKKSEIPVKHSNTFLTYNGVIKRFWKITRSEKITRESIVNHLEGLKRNDYKPSVINYDFDRLSSEYLKQSQGDKEQRVKDLKKIKNRYYTKNLNSDYSEKSIPENEIQVLIVKLPKRLSLIIETLANTGLRISELISIKKSNKDKLKSDLYVTYFDIIGKGNKQRKIFIENELLERIEKVFSGKTYLFETKEGKNYNRTYVTRKLSELSGKILNKNISSHTLRHSFVTNEIKNGTPIDAVSRQAGHSSIAFTLSKYSHNKFNPEMKKTKFKGKQI
ncbi:MAG: tyrosine-type recombinase/integrase [Leptospiraceae bacterium]|nr:tyrosine-type recombinase/integrase [Leptospiraceae bacterium]